MLNKYISDNEIGLDEAGRGPLIGRVYAGAVIWNTTITNDMIKDSKKLSAKKRAIALEWIKSNVTWGVGYAEASEIDSINILEATRLAMERAINNLKEKYTVTENILIVDGIGWNQKFPNYKVTSIVKGDSKYYSIAAASIIAKEYHDNYIKELCDNNILLNERYDLLNNVGYGTKKHIDGIIKYGISNFHRKSFKPCCEYI